MSCLACFLLEQRLDVSACTHDHGADVTKAVRLARIHSLLCFDHELDSSVKVGIDCPGFAALFAKAAHIAATIRKSNNLYRRLRDYQVSRDLYFSVLFFFACCDWFCSFLTWLLVGTLGE